MKRVVITGLGILSSIGNNTKEVLESLRVGRSGITFSQEMKDSGMRSHVCGNVKLDTTGLIDRKVVRFMNDASIYGLLLSSSFVLCALFTPQTPIIWIILVLFFSGGARSIQFTTITTLSFSEIDKTEIQSANILSTIFQQLNNVLGIVLSALFLFIASSYNSHSQTGLMVEDFRLALLMVAAMTLLAMIDFITLPKNAGNNLKDKQ